MIKMSLQEQYAHDPSLLDHYEHKLLEPGWAGELTPDELAYIKSQLKDSRSLRRRWGFRPSAKRFSESRVRAVAGDGVQTRASFSFSRKRT